jgi:biopolymer transport protein ExbB
MATGDCNISLKHHPFHAPAAILGAIFMTILGILLEGGPVLYAIAALSLYAVYVFLERLQRLVQGFIPLSRLLAQVRGHLSEGNLALAVSDCKKVDAPAARVLEAGLHRLSHGPVAVEAALNDAGYDEEERAGRGLGTLATIAQLAPMLGLLGTVIGMVRAFAEFTTAAQPTPAQLAGGISQALITTAAGLVVAILAHFGHSLLMARAERLLAQLDRVREQAVGLFIETNAYATPELTSRTELAEDDSLANPSRPVAKTLATSGG